MTVIKVFFDTNVILDFLLDRPGCEYADMMVEAARTGKIRAYTSAVSLTNIAYIMRKSFDADGTRKILRQLLTWCNVTSEGEQTFHDVLKMDGPDIEDCVQIVNAEEKDCDLIVTRNAAHFSSQTVLPVMTPREFIEKTS